MTRGQAALQVMESALAQTPFIAGPTYTIADIALYAYTHSAERVGFDLSAPHVRAWLGRVREQPRHLPMHTSARYPERP